MFKKSKWSSNPWIIMYVVEKSNGDVFDRYWQLEDDTPKKQVLAIAEKHKPTNTLKTYVYKAKLIAIDDDDMWERWWYYKWPNGSWVSFCGGFRRVTIYNWIFRRVLPHNSFQFLETFRRVVPHFNQFRRDMN